MNLAKSSHGERIAAFFDLDGTLIPAPSLEWRFFAELGRRRAIPASNYSLWLREAARLAPQGLGMVQHANKMYLRGVCVDGFGVRAAGGETERAVPHFFRPAVERVAWHAAQGHAIVLVSGTLAPLARTAAVVLATKLAFRGISGSIEVCATELEEVEGRWTGRILGPAMFGEAKAESVKRFAREHRVMLERSYAYADSLSDLPMLEAVGRPVIVNPSRGLQRIARQKDWPILLWWEKKDPAQRAERRQTRSEAIGENLG
jgi:alcohol-forming fatty acyl-CoA reductase